MLLDQQVEQMLTIVHFFYILSSNTVLLGSGNTRFSDHIDFTIKCIYGITTILLHLEISIVVFFGHL